MALTAEGTELTEAHRLAQIAIAARAAAASKILWRRLDVADLDASTPAWLQANVALVRRFQSQSVAAAAQYVGQYRMAELGVDVGDISRPAFNPLLERQTLLLAGPVRVKLLVGRGMPAETAYDAAFRKYSGIVRRESLAGGRQLVDKTTRSDSRAVGWRRVSDGDPCTFCAMLCSRGPVYASRERAEAVAGSGLRFHGHCGCTAEIVYGEWKPNEEEQRFIDLYEQAAQQANAAGQPRTQDTVLWRMRANGGFKDSPRAT